MPSYPMAALTAFVLVTFIGCVASQELLVLGNANNGDLEKNDDLKPAIPTHRPYSPLKPMQVPPLFQNMGINLPPPPPPPLFIQDPHSHFLVELGQHEKFLAGFFDQFKPFFAWLNPKPKPTSTATTTASTTTATTVPTTADP